MEENNKRPLRVDMSPEAIGRRLRELGQLYKLGMSLQKARRIGTVEELQQAVEAPPKKQGGDTP